jgi:hypothetical protein
MQIGGTGRGDGRPGGVARRGLSGGPGFLGGPVRRPGAVPDRRGPLGPVRERPSGLDRGSRAQVVGAGPFEDRQRG